MDLPIPDPDALAISQQLQSLIAEEIRQHGPIGFDRYMEMCLYAPGLGYYMAGSRKFGPDGDFVTAPEISSLFSQCLARQCHEAFQALPQQSILEFGAGCGVMAADILLELDRLQSLPDHYLILEISPDLRQRQQQYIQKLPAHLARRVQWLDTLPRHFSGVILANEVLDALPVPRFISRGQTCEEMTVSLHGSDMGWATRPAPEPVQHFFSKLQQNRLSLEDGYISEMHPRQSAWLNSLADHLQQAVVMLIDYGHSEREYYHPQRSQGTLQCHYRQRSHSNPFIWPGLQDLTAHINFTALAQTAQTIGMDLLGYSTQGNFLLSAGITQLAESDTSTDPIDLAQQIKQLTLPTGMGEQFKALALGLNCQTRLSGFKLKDLRHQL